MKLKISQIEINNVWASYQRIENQLIDLTYYIDFDDTNFSPSGNEQNQLQVYSNRIADLLMICCTQIESMFLLIDKVYSFNIKHKDIGGLIKVIDSKLSLSEKQVKIISPLVKFTGFYKDYFAPMNYTVGNKEDYYTIYNSIKHNRFAALKNAKLYYLINAMAGLFILCAYATFEEKQFDERSEVDPTFGKSSFFEAKYLNDSALNLLNKSYIFYYKERETFNDEMKEVVDKATLNNEDDKKIYDLEGPKRFIIKLNN